MHFKYRNYWLVGMVMLIGYAACRKADAPLSQERGPSAITRFFYERAPATPLVQSIRDYAIWEQAKAPFAEALIRQIGYPQWNKALTIAGASPSRSGRGAEDSVHITYVPFVRDSQQHVNATLAVATSPGDTSLRIFCDWQYADTTATGLSKAQFALTMMALDEAVFGNRLYQLTDTTIFHHRSRYIRPHAPGSGATKSTASTSSSLLEWVYTYTICWTEYVPLYEGQVVGCGPVAGCPFYTAVESCIQISWSSGGGGGGGSTGPIGGTGGGGGSGSGGGWVPPNNPNPCGGVASLIETQEGCGVGWVPVGGGGGGVPPPGDSLLNKYVKTFLQVGDSIYRNLSAPGNKEYFILGAKKKNALDTVLLNIKTDNDSTTVRPNLSSVGYVILYFWHSHVSQSLNPADRRSFSPDDIWTMGFPACLKQNFVSFAYCGNKIYALVISDLSKATAFFNSTDRSKIIDAYTTVGSGDMQQVDERCVKNVIGSLAQNGIGFYVSTNSPSFTAWTLLN